MQHYYSEKQTSPLRLKKIKAILRGISFEFYTASGIFSPKKIDRGTKILIERLIMEKDWKVLDFGCGYGPVGITTAKCFPETQVLMIDINRRAIQLANMNIKLNNLSNISAKYSNLFENIDQKFDTILVNPPQTAGRKLCFEIIGQSKKYLEKDGLLQLVARHNKGGSELSKKMKEVFGNVNEIAKKSGYRVYISKN